MHSAAAPSTLCESTHAPQDSTTKQSRVCGPSLCPVAHARLSCPCQSRSHARIRGPHAHAHPYTGKLVSVSVCMGPCSSPSPGGHTPTLFTGRSVCFSVCSRESLARALRVSVFFLRSKLGLRLPGLARLAYERILSTMKSCPNRRFHGIFVMFWGRGAENITHLP